MNCLAVPFLLVLLCKHVLTLFSAEEFLSVHGLCAATQATANAFLFHKFIGGIIIAVYRGTLFRKNHFLYQEAKKAVIVLVFIELTLVPVFTATIILILSRSLNKLPAYDFCMTLTGPFDVNPLTYPQIGVILFVGSLILSKTLLYCLMFKMVRTYKNSSKLTVTQCKKCQHLIDAIICELIAIIPQPTAVATLAIIRSGLIVSYIEVTQVTALSLIIALALSFALFPTSLIMTSSLLRKDLKRMLRIRNFTQTTATLGQEMIADELGQLLEPSQMRVGSEPACTARIMQGARIHRSASI